MRGYTDGPISHYYRQDHRLDTWSAAGVAVCAGGLEGAWMDMITLAYRTSYNYALDIEYVVEVRAFASVEAFYKFRNDWQHEDDWRLVEMQK